MSPNFSALPPELNSARLFAGAGPEPMLVTASAWDGLAAELRSAAASFGSITTALAAGSWQGPASLMMADAVAPYVQLLNTSAAQAEGAAGLARAAASEYEAALAAAVHPAVVGANRLQLMSLVASNLFGQNCPAIATIDFLYEQMWAQDVSAMASYHAGASAVVARLTPWQQQLQSALTAAAAGWGVQPDATARPNFDVAKRVSAAIGTANSTATQTVAMVMGGSGYPIPSAWYAQVANELYIQRGVPGAIAHALFTPEGLYPVTDVKDLTFDMSLARGITILDNTIRQHIAAGNNVTVFGYSQSAAIASLEMSKLAASINPPTPDQLSFTLIGNPSNPNGGIATRFPGLSLPAFGVTSIGATPDNLYPTRVYTIEYDGVPDFPRYPINVLSTLNAVLGAYYVHNNYFLVTPEQLDSAVQLTNTLGPSMTQYYMIRTENLPLLEPLRALPIIGNPLADLVQPNLKVIVNLGYGDPAYGFSTSPPNVQTPFGLFPEVHPVTVVDALVAGTHEGISDFAYGINHLGYTLPTDLSVQLMSSATTVATVSAPGAGAPLVLSVDSIVSDLKVLNTKAFNTVTTVADASYATLLPTAGVINTLVTTAPAYNINLFLDGILQAAHGDPMGFVNAVGYPIAADVALITVAGGIQVLVLIDAGLKIADAVSALVA